MQHDNEREPQVKKASVPVMKIIDGRACWLAFGTQEYRHEPELERMWRAAHMAKYWTRIHHRDTRARQMADRHYSRRTPGAAEFIPAGHKVVLMHFLPDGTPAALWASHRAASSANLARPRFDGLDVWDCSIFRIEHRTVEASTLIREAVAITRGVWPELPRDGFYTTIDPRHVAPIKRRGRDVWGYSYIKAGWRVLPARTLSRKLIQLVLPGDDLARVVPITAEYEYAQQSFLEAA
jgi:hypothetical protein